ncbi:MAG: hypothetical protein OXG27_04920, partial [Chloroflexi bacterium]|nr:hypothetical protein [Chloroflexota bacterium]
MRQASVRQRRHFLTWAVVVLLGLAGLALIGHAHPAAASTAATSSYVVKDSDGVAVSGSVELAADGAGNSNVLTLELGSDPGDGVEVSLLLYVSAAGVVSMTVSPSEDTWSADNPLQQRLVSFSGGSDGSWNNPVTITLTAAATGEAILSSFSLASHIVNGQRVSFENSPYYADRMPGIRIVVGQLSKQPPAQPEISVTAGAGVSEGGSAKFTVTSAPAPQSPLTVNITVSQTGDFGASTGTGTVVIPTSGSVSHAVATVDDSVDEGDGSVTLTLNAGDGYTVSSSKGSASVALVDNDAPPTTCITTNADLLARVEDKTEDPWNGARPDLLEMFTRSYNTLKGEDDYTTADIKSRPDRQDQKWQGSGPNELWQQIYVELDNLTVCRETGESVDPPRPEVSIAAGTGITEGGSASFTITASPAPSSSLSVSVTVTQSGDYGASTGSRTVTIPVAGSAQHSVATVGDSVDESDGSVTVTLNPGSGYTVSTNQGAATVAVSDDDDPPPSLTPEISVAAGADVNEGGATTFTVTANPIPTGPLTISLTVAQQGDFGVATGVKPVVIPTTGSAHYSVSTVDDSVDEADGSVSVSLNSGRGYTVSASQGTATVAVSDNDVPEISVSAGRANTEGGNATFIVTAAPSPASPISVTITVTQTGDYGASTGTSTVTVPTSGSVNHAVATTDDEVDEPDGTITLTLNAGSGYTVSSTQRSASVAVQDDDGPATDEDAPADPTISVTAGSGITEGGTAMFTVTADPAPTAPLAVSVT